MDVELVKNFLSSRGFANLKHNDFEGFDFNELKQIYLFKLLFKKRFFDKCVHPKKYWAVNSENQVYFKNSESNFEVINKLVSEYVSLFSSLIVKRRLGVEVGVSFELAKPLRQHSNGYPTVKRFILFSITHYCSSSLFAWDYFSSLSKRLVVESKIVKQSFFVKNNPSLKVFLDGCVNVLWSDARLLKNYVDQPIFAGFKLLGTGVVVVKTARTFKAVRFFKNFYGVYTLVSISVGEALSLIKRFRDSEKEFYLVDESEANLKQFSLFKNL